jgi:hypothetical protein
VDHVRADGRRGARHGFGTEGLHRIESLPPVLEQNADEIDHHIRLARSRLDRGGMTHIGLHGMDLADLAERLQEAGKLGAADGDANAVAEFRQRAHDVTAEEARAAEYGDERFERNRGHARSNPSLAEYRIALMLYRARPFDNEGPASYLIAQSPGGGIGRRTSFRY